MTLMELLSSVNKLSTSTEKKKEHEITMQSFRGAHKKFNKTLHMRTMYARN